MSKPVVVYVVQPSNSIVPTYDMRWGGSHRLSFWHLQALSRSGLDLHVVAPRDSRLDLPNTQVVLSESPGLLTLPKSEFDAGLRQWTKDVVDVINKTKPDLILAQGPDLAVLEAIPNEYRSKTIFCSHYSFKTQLPRRQWLLDHPEVSITAVSEIHRLDMGELANRATVTRAGVPVESFRFRPTVERPRAPGLEQVAAAFDRSRGRLLSQVDRLSPDKSQRSAVKAFLQSRLPDQGWIFVVAGDEFVDGVPPSVAQDDERVTYSTEVSDLAESSRGSVVLLGPQYGEQVEEIYGASRFVIAPFGLDFKGYREAFGLAPAIAQSVGTPVLASNAIDQSCVETGVSGWRFDNASELTQTLNDLGSEMLRVDRRAVRRWAEEHQGLEQMIRSYGTLIAERARRAGKEWVLKASDAERGQREATRLSTRIDQTSLSNTQKEVSL